MTAMVLKTCYASTKQGGLLGLFLVWTEYPKRLSNLLLFKFWVHHVTCKSRRKFLKNKQPFRTYVFSNISWPFIQPGHSVFTASSKERQQNKQTRSSFDLCVLKVSLLALVF